MTFGIPIDDLPSSYGAELKKANHPKWIAQRRKKENKLKTTDAFRRIDLPGRHDVLSGRGKTIHQYTGNSNATFGAVLRGRVLTTTASPEISSGGKGCQRRSKSGRPVFRENSRRMVGRDFYQSCGRDGRK
jgi:hypothetical protein